MNQQITTHEDDEWYPARVSFDCQNPLPLIQVGGDGLWSQHQCTVRLTEFELSGEINPSDNQFHVGQLTVIVEPADWDNDVHGLIYTDKTFLEGLRDYLNSIDILFEDGLSYSEQGMQPDNGAHFDVSGECANAVEQFVVDNKVPVDRV